MNLVASLVLRNELSRYLAPCIEHLRAFCDMVCVLDDHSDDGTWEWLLDHADDQLWVTPLNKPNFFVHEGRTRHLLVGLTMNLKPTHVLSVDADEFVSDGAALRAAIDRESNAPVLSLDILEIWKADADHLSVRLDGGWRPHPLSVLWRVDPNVRYTIMDRKLACRRVPVQVLAQKATPSGVELLHFGWTDPATRQARYDRYTKHDGGRFHAGSHLRSIMADERTMQFREMPWPESEVFDGLRERLCGMPT